MSLQVCGFSHQAQPRAVVYLFRRFWKLPIVLLTLWYQIATPGTLELSDYTQEALYFPLVLELSPNGYPLRATQTYLKKSSLNRLDSLF